MKAHLNTFLFSIMLVLVACSSVEQPAETVSAVSPQSQPNPTATIEPTTEPAQPPAIEAELDDQTAASETPPAIPVDENDKVGAEETAPVTEEVSPTKPTSKNRTFVIVPDQTQASYIVAEEFFGGALDRLGIQPGLVDTIGRTQEVEGSLQLDLNNLTDPVLSSQFSVNLRSLTSDQPRRDNRIREANLESNRYPLATFTITSLENTPAAYSDGAEISFQANGDITIREITQPATFDVTARLAGGSITGVATTALRMTDFGFEPPDFANLFSVQDQFTVRVDFTFKEQP